MITLTQMSKAAEWLKEARRARGWNPAQLARFADVDRTTIDRIEKEGRKPQTGTLEKLCKALRVDEDAVQDWIDGESDYMPLPSKLPPRGTGQTRSGIPANLRTNPNLVPLPVVGGSPAGGGNSDTPHEYPPGFADRYCLVPPEVAADPDAQIIRVVGDSAQPYLGPGDLVVVSPNAPEVPGALYYVQHDGDLDEAHRLKRVFPIDGEEDHLELRSFNSDYPPFRVERRSITRKALVLYLIRPMDVVLNRR